MRERERGTWICNNERQSKSSTPLQQHRCAATKRQQEREGEIQIRQKKTLIPYLYVIFIARFHFIFYLVFICYPRHLHMVF
jgi:hypothetical protein